LNRNRAFYLVAAAVILLDQATKMLVSGRMSLGESIPLIDSYLSLTYIRNKGIAFGLFSGGGSVKSVVLGIFSMVAVFILIWLLTGFDRDDVSAGAAIGLVTGGALGNLIDRFRLGEVIDFIDAYWGQHHWPAFNVADSCITVGVVLLIVKLLFQERKRTENG
jgi:signal peptidase II